MSTPLHKGSPNWLSQQDPEDPALNKNYRRSVLYYRALYAAWPDWCADDPGFKEVYDTAKQLRADGQDVHVDHIIPICSPIVSGLHVPWNLTILTAADNRRKGNKWWPDHPFENRDLFDG